MEKAKNVGISLYPSEIEEVKRLSLLRDAGSPTRYFRRLFDADKRHTPVPTGFDDRIFEKLAGTYAGYLAPRLTHALQQVNADQPKILHDLLVQFAEALANGASPSEITVAPQWSNAGQSLAVAEDPTPYSKPVRIKKI